MLNNRQFILTKQTTELFPHWESVKLANNYNIYYHPKLRVLLNRDMTFAIIGDVWQVDKQKNSPSTIIDDWHDNTTLDTIYEEEETWCGRFIIVTPDFILTDATSNLGCFYTHDAISSSFAILAQMIDNERNTPPIAAVPLE